MSESLTDTINRLISPNSTDEDLLNHCELIFKKWKYGEKYTINEFLVHCANECKITMPEITNGDIIHSQFKEKVKEIAVLLPLIEQRGLKETKYTPEITYYDVMNNLILVLGNMMHALFSINLSMLAHRPSFDCSMNLDNRLQRIKLEMEPKMPETEILFRYTLSYIHRLNYRRKGNAVYQPVYTSDGNYTHAYAHKMEISELVHTLTNKDENTDIWRILYAKGNVTNLTNFLTNCQEYEFPELKSNRSIFSFKNGVYDASEHLFFPYDTYKLSHSIVACKYFDMDFDYIKTDTPKFDWYNDIETPSFQSILDPQFQEEEDYHEICKTAYVLIGRMLYDIGARDKWQVIPFFKGMAQTGKSTILKDIVKMFYESCDVGILNNDCAENFPVENLYDKKAWVALDIDNRFRLPQMSFQSMISGEDISVMRKHKTPLDIEWTVPGAMSGNELFGYNDNGGSIGRRIILFEFMKIITNAQLDSNLTFKIRTELPHILQKCNIAYLEASSTWNKQNIWHHIPQYFHDKRAYLLEQTNSLMEFLTSDHIKYDKNTYIAKDEFVQMFMNYCKDHGLKSKKFNRDYYSSPFALIGSKNSVNIALKRSPLINGVRRTGQYISGITINNVIDNDETI